ncbi:MAG: iron chelate uptake ABC transporter family permease subunit [Pseudonocardia sp.]|mgnify:CR=1 FL=1|uniref:FecCD family ABC transporter permease n=1 Tax=unclassified Pseudonocardia TaxID=2619320 RepID=UPI000B2806A2|nr:MULTISPECIES: iron chelate uptake ABC transporter family permease subunit [unclassified Pseudonocardia]MBN9107885.1 iron chelate uptake ABC transporter family permease subunit [Pseudonocardia sp.]
MRSRRVTGLLLLAVLLVVVCLASIAIGAKAIPLDHVWSALFSPTGTEDDVVVRSLRIPRTVLGLLAGAALGLAGALMQGHTRNPLADPGLLGVNAGAAFLVVIGIHVFGISSLTGYVWFAFAGALAASVAVFLLGSTGRAGATPVTLAVAGAAVSALLFGLTSAVILTDVRTLDAYRFWNVGSLAGREPAIAAQVAPFLLVGVLIALATAPALNALSLGDDVAKSLGHSVTRTRVLGVIAITLLAGSATAACGPIAFLGLIVPHVVRSFTGPDHRWLLPASALSGAVLLLTADVVGRVVARPGELQVGIVLALIGAPFFIALVRRKRLAQL